MIIDMSSIDMVFLSGRDTDEEQCVAYENKATRWWVSKDRWNGQEVIFIDNEQIKYYYD